MKVKEKCACKGTLQAKSTNHSKNICTGVDGVCVIRAKRSFAEKHKHWIPIMQTISIVISLITIVISCFVLMQ